MTLATVVVEHRLPRRTLKRAEIDEGRFPPKLVSHSIDGSSLGEPGVSIPHVSTKEVEDLKANVVFTYPCALSCRARMNAVPGH